MCEQKQLQPLHVQLQRVKDLTPPDFGTLVQWEKRAIGSIRANGDNNDDPVKTAHANGLSGTPMPFLGETKVCLKALKAIEWFSRSNDESNVWPCLYVCVRYDTFMFSFFSGKWLVIQFSRVDMLNFLYDIVL